MQKYSQALRDALFKIGHILPETTSEISQFDKIIPKKDLHQIPEELRDITKIIETGKKIIGRPKTAKNEMPNQIARAARFGQNKISDKILNQMKKDRKKAESDNEKSD